MAGKQVLAACLLTCWAAATALGALPQRDRVLLMPTPREITDVTLTNQEGDAVKLSSLRGRPALVFFGFTNCPDICPAAMAKYRTLERSGLIDPDEVSLVLVSVDGERDTPEAMKQFLGQFSDRIVGLTGDPAYVQKMAKQFRAPFYKGSGHDYSVAHSAQIFLLDSDGRLRAELHDSALEDIAELANLLIDEPR